MTDAPIEYLTPEERERYQQVGVKVDVLDKTWRRFGGDDLLSELSLATLEKARLEELARTRKEGGE